jgi:hypothetical protein
MEGWNVDKTVTSSGLQVKRAIRGMMEEKNVTVASFRSQVL